MPCPYPKQCCPLLPVLPLLASRGCERLGCCTTGSCFWARSLWVLILDLFFLPVILPSEIPRLTTDPPERVFPGILKLLSLFFFFFFFQKSGSLTLCCQQEKQYYCMISIDIYASKKIFVIDVFIYFFLFFIF